VVLRALEAVVEMVVDQPLDNKEKLVELVESGQHKVQVQIIPKMVDLLDLP